MDNSVALQASPPPPSGLMSRLAELPPKRRLALGGGVAALVAIALVLAMWSSKPDYKVLYANLSDKDGGAIVAQLSQMNIPYRHAEGGGAILVPADKVHDLRLKLASQGLPRGSTVGFELMDSARFGITQFQERLTFQRGLEGELMRSIQGLAAVESARVHLALPNQNGFFREQQKPSASVLLQLHPGRTLDRAQIAGIVHLVSSSVPEMSPKAVSILDQSGALLTESPDAARGQSLDAQQLQYVNQLEAIYTRRIVDLLEPVLGRENLRAQVTAEVDFSQTESTSEQFRPNQGENPATVRSQQTLESSQNGPQLPTGVPGAATNQPPQPAEAPVNGAAQPLQAAPGNAPGTVAGPLRREAVTNYEVDKTVRVTRAATGTVKRLNAAVVVNHRNVVDPKGKAAPVELSPEEIEKLTALVRETIGFNAERGDSVRVISAPFTVPAETPELPLWQQPQMLELLRDAAVPLLLTLMALAIVFGVVRPAIKAAAPQPEVPPPGSQLDALVDDKELLPAFDADGNPITALVDGTPTLPALGAPVADKQKLDNVRSFAKDNPVAVANIVRGWVNKDKESV
ncbi:flagellar basal-body MS-ring/collar protein FliF [Aquabacterium tepidiphilum]|uniref:flagellar basal-body MS-ring/collar protein FliF n=1 Tax=Caldimonas tepidiphila TaxID=2315841 RepID=UPI000E5ABF06